MRSKLVLLWSSVGASESRSSFCFGVLLGLVNSGAVSLMGLVNAGCILFIFQLFHYHKLESASDQL